MKNTVLVWAVYADGRREPAEWREFHNGRFVTRSTCHVDAVLELDLSWEAAAAAIDARWEAEQECDHAQSTPSADGHGAFCDFCGTTLA